VQQPAQNTLATMLLQQQQQQQGLTMDNRSAQGLNIKINLNLNNF